MSQNTAAGILLMIGACFIFSVQDALSRVMAGAYGVWMIVMIRYWVHAAYVLTLAARRPGGIRAALRTRQPWFQILRSLTLAAEICVAVLSLSRVGLVAHHALFVAGPLLVVALSGPVLGETVGWRRWSAVLVGLVGILIVVRPGPELLQPAAVLPLLSALLFALYGLMNRYAARTDSTATSFLWTGLVGAVALTPLGLWTWTPMTPAGWAVMALLCGTAILGHWLYIRCYEVAEASAIQPFAYLHLVFAGGIGIAVFADPLSLRQAIGAAIVVAAGLFAWWRERQRG